MFFFWPPPFCFESTVWSSLYGSGCQQHAAPGRTAGWTQKRPGWQTQRRLKRQFCRVSTDHCSVLTGCSWWAPCVGHPGHPSGWRPLAPAAPCCASSKLSKTPSSPPGEISEDPETPLCRRLKCATCPDSGRPHAVDGAAAQLHKQTHTTWRQSNISGALNVAYMQWYSVLFRWGQVSLRVKCIFQERSDHESTKETYNDYNKT